MDNNNSIRFEHTPYHNVYLKDRKNIELTGVKNIESFDSLEFLIETSLGFLNITGTELSLTRPTVRRSVRTTVSVRRLFLPSCTKSVESYLYVVL